MIRARLAAIALVATFALAGCQATDREDLDHGATAEEAAALQREVTEFQTVWARGVGMVGYVKTYMVSNPPDAPVELHFVEDMDFREMGWITNSGKGERYQYLEEKQASAHRAAFKRVELPVDTLENQVRRIFGLDPLTDIRLVPSSQADLRR
ncbi:MAG: hypothetical protein ACYTG4_06080 [Planctomycetota bacterium]|jgi:hypothetical protein